jgi:hypothetical protein
MNRVEGTSFVLFPQGEIEQLKSMQLQILEAIKTLHLLAANRLQHLRI